MNEDYLGPYARITKAMIREAERRERRELREGRRICHELAKDYEREQRRQEREMERRKNPPPSEMWLYLIARVDDRGAGSPVKVGVSRNPASRIKSIQNGCPFPVQIFASFHFDDPASDARRAEGVFHARHSSRRLAGEWFDLTPGEAREAIIDLIGEMSA